MPTPMPKPKPTPTPTPFPTKTTPKGTPKQTSGDILLSIPVPTTQGLSTTEEETKETPPQTVATSHPPTTQPSSTRILLPPGTFPPKSSPPPPPCPCLPIPFVSDEGFLPASFSYSFDCMTVTITCPPGGVVLLGNVMSPSEGTIDYVFPPQAHFIKATLNCVNNDYFVVLPAEFLGGFKHSTPVQNAHHRLKMVLFGNYTLSSASNFGQLPYYMKLFFVATPFYPKLNQNQVTQLMAIVQNTHLTQEQLEKELIEWGKRQPSELHKDLEDFGVKFIEAVTELAKKIEEYRFSPETEPYGVRIKEINAKNNITILESDKLISDVIDSAPIPIQPELARFIFWLQVEFMTMVYNLSKTANFECSSVF